MLPWFWIYLQLEIYEMIGQAISNSRRAGGEVRFVSQEAFCTVFVLVYFGIWIDTILSFWCFSPLSPRTPFTFGTIALSELPAAWGLVFAKQPLPHLEPQPHGLG